MKDQFNGNTEKTHPPPHLTCHEIYEMVKDVHVVLGKRKRTGKNTEEDDMWKKQLIFLELSYWKDLDARHSIDVMHIEKTQFFPPARHRVLRSHVPIPRWSCKLRRTIKHTIVYPGSAPATR
jgi:hypothetical protein